MNLRNARWSPESMQFTRSIVSDRRCGSVTKPSGSRVRILRDPRRYLPIVDAHPKYRKSLERRVTASRRGCQRQRQRRMKGSGAMHARNRSSAKHRRTIEGSIPKGPFSISRVSVRLQRQINGLAARHAPRIVSSVGTFRPPAEEQ